jgi:hypothetical protein
MKAALMMFGAMAVLVPSIGAAQETPVVEQRQTIAVPQTPEQHFERARAYRDKAVALRQEAALHRRMFADYESRIGVPALKAKTGVDSPWVAKMRKHCDALIKAADAHAVEAERFAEFHTMRGKEMQGE